MLFLCNFCMLLGNILEVPMKYSFDRLWSATSMVDEVIFRFYGMYNS